MQKFQNLQNSPYFQVMPQASKDAILSQPDLAAACREAKIQYEENIGTIYHAAQKLIKEGKGIAALAIIGKAGQDPEDLSEADYKKLIELDPFTYHPHSQIATPRSAAAIRKFLQIDQ